jgi:hypothetical protein
MMIEIVGLTVLMVVVGVPFWLEYGFFLGGFHG